MLLVASRRAGAALRPRSGTVRLGLFASIVGAFTSSVQAYPMDSSAFYGLRAGSLNGGDALEFASLKGKVVLVTNVASK